MPPPPQKKKLDGPQYFTHSLLKWSYFLIFFPKIPGAGRTIFVILAKLGTNIRFFFEKIALTHLKFVFSIYFGSKIHQQMRFFLEKTSFFQKRRPNPCNSLEFEIFFGFFLITKSRSYIGLFFRKKNKYYGSSGIKVGKQLSTGIYGNISSFF